MVTAAILAVAIAGTAVAAYGQYQEGKAAESQARAEAAWHEYNAKVARREEEAERQATAFEVQQHRREAKQLLARQRALVGKAGVTAEGSPLLFAEDTASQLALESTMIRMGGARRAARFRSQSILDISMAGAAKSRATAYGKAGALRAGSTLLGGMADIGMMGHKMGTFGKKTKTTGYTGKGSASPWGLSKNF